MAIYLTDPRKKEAKTETKTNKKKKNKNKTYFLPNKSQCQNNCVKFIPCSVKRICFLGQVQDQEQQQQHLLGGQLLAEEQPTHSLQIKECQEQVQGLPSKNRTRQTST